MTKFTTFEIRLVPLPVDNIHTDQRPHPPVVDVMDAGSLTILPIDDIISKSPHRNNSLRGSRFAK